MANERLTVDKDFIVSDDKVLVNVMAFLFFGIFVYGLIDSFRRGFEDMDYLSYVFILLLVPAALFFAKGRRKRIYIRINKSGIFQDEKLVTGWPGFLHAFVTQKEKILSIQDNFMLVVEYTKEGNDKGFRRKIPLTNTQNKSEEEVMEAITFFWKVYKTSTFE